jgi:O-antigen ligase
VAAARIERVPPTDRNHAIVTWAATAIDRRLSPAGALAALVPAGARTVATLGGLLLIAAALAWQPFLAAGAVVGGLLIWVTFTWPVPVIGVMLALGPLDLSFVTGGFKELFPELGGLDMNGIRLVAMTGGLLLVVATDRGLLESLTLPRAAWYLVFLAFAGLTLAWSPDRLEGLRLLFKLAYPLLVFLVLTAPGRSAHEMDRLATWILIGAAALLILNPAFVAAGGSVRDYDGSLRIGGAGIHQNPFSFYLLVIVLLCAARFAVRGQARYLALAALAVVWMALTLTRITMAAALVGLVGMSLYGALINRNYRGALVGLGLAALIGAALTPVVLTRSFGYTPSLGSLLDLARDPVALFNAVNWQGRQVIWPVLAQAWSTSPWLGLGMGASSVVLDTAFPGLPMVPHNEYLRLGVDAGWLGVVLFFTAMVAWLHAGLQAGRSGAPGVREHALPALAGTLAWAIIAATDNAFDYYGPFTQFIGFFTAAALVTARDGADASASAAPNVPSSTNGTHSPTDGAVA